MIDHCAVTTFSKAGYNLYGQRMLETFLKHWDIPIVVFTENQELERMDTRVVTFDLFTDPDRRQWLNQYDNEKNRGRWENPFEQPIKYGEKVWAVTGDRLPCRWWIWIDGDTLWHKDVNGDALAEMCPEDCCLSFLGRTVKWRLPLDGSVCGPWPETSFVAYRVEDLRVQSLLDDMRHVYVSGELFTLGRNRQHDAYTFEHCRRRSGIPEQEQHNMAAGMKMLHPWPHTILGKYGTHQKGPARKKKVYGGVV